MKQLQFHRLAFGILVALILITSSISSAAQSDHITPTRYLAFQVFTGTPSPNFPLDSGAALSAPPSKETLRQFVQEIISQIGTSGDPSRRLAFIIGPLAFDHTDSQLRQMVQDSFAIALELKVAVGFHIDDSIFWARRDDLWRDPQHVEWLDWDGTPNTGRRLDWGPQPTKVAPQMCFNSPAVQAEVTRLAGVIGGAVQEGVQQLETQGQLDLFAGVIAGWETQIGRDFDTDQWLGYCALTNRGFSRDNLPQDPDGERVRAVQAFIELWAVGLQQAGVDPARIYAHTAFVTPQNFQEMNRPGISYAQVNQFALPEVSFGEHYQPGFSTYPQRGLMNLLYGEVQQHDNPDWASAEGSTVNPAAAESVVKTETYLGWMFNHGAALVNIFGWGIGPVDNPFRKAAENPEAIRAYRKFLDGETLVEDTTDLAPSIAGTLPDKIQRIQAALPNWVQGHPDRQNLIEPLVEQLDHALKAGTIEEAQTIADTILQMIEL